MKPGNEPSERAREAGRLSGSALLLSQLGLKPKPTPPIESAPEDSDDEQ